MARMPGQGVAASVGDPTTPGTATAEVQEQGVPLPPPGLHLASTHWTLPIGVYLSLRLHRPGDYRHLQEVCPALEDRL